MKTALKNGLYLLSFSIFAGLMASCLGNNSTVADTYPITDAELLSLNLTSDSVPLLDSVFFAIDQRAGLIANYDSMPFQTVIKDSVIIAYISGAGTDNILNITNGDSIWVKNGDSISISNPLTLRVYALDGKTTKTYTLQLNIHQVDPDSMQYAQAASGLSFLQTEDTKTVAFNDRFLTYSRINNEIQLTGSSDAVNWVQETCGLPANAVISGIQNAGNRLFVFTDDGNLYVRDSLAVTDQWTLVDKPSSIKIKSILGYLSASPNNPEGLSLIVESAGVNTFAMTDKNLAQWNYDSIAPTPVPDNFPLSGFSSYGLQQMYLSRITVFGGISADGTVQNATWATSDGRYWAKLTNDVNVYPPLEGANVFYYNNEFWLINGKSGNDYNKDVYYSPDGGITWQLQPVKCNLPDDYLGRYGASLVLDKDNKYFYIIGGKQTSVLSDVWKGFLNKVEFDH
jgi:hypothetical protein